MVPEHSKMISIIFAVCCFGVVHSQAGLNSPYSSFAPVTSSPWQSASPSGAGTSSAASRGAAAAYSRTGASYASSSGSAVSSSGSQQVLPGVSNAQLQPSVPPAADLTVGEVAHYLKQLLSNSYVLNAVPDFVVTDALMYKVGRVILDKRNIKVPGLVELVTDAVRDFGPVTKDLFLNTVSHTLAKVLYRTAALTQETALTFPSIFLRYVEDHGIRNGISDVESVLQALGNGFFDFLDSIGLLDVPRLRLAAQILTQELKALARGEEI